MAGIVFIPMDLARSMIQNIAIIAMLVLLYNFIPETIRLRSKLTFSIGAGIVFGLAALISIPDFWGTAGGQIIGFNISGNTLYNTGSWPNPNYHFNLLLGGGATRQNIQVQNNYSYLTPSANAGGNSLGQYTIGQNITATNNVFAGGNIALYADGE